MSNQDHDTVPVILIRHAQSVWNRDNRFTGWSDPPLTAAGVAEAVQAGDLLRRLDYRFDVAWTSRLRRALTTTDILLERLEQTGIPQYREWRLNERHYGSLQGLDKTQASARVGDEQVWRWRRGYEDRAEGLAHDDPTHPRNDPLYADIDPQRLPAVENLAETRARVVEFWIEHIRPHLHRGERVLISAHGNTLRALLMDLAGMSVSEVEGFEIPTATPILYRFERSGRALDWQYLSETARAYA